ATPLSPHLSYTRNNHSSTFPGNPYDGHTLHKQLTQTQTLLENAGSTPKQVIVDLGFRGVDADNPDVNIIHRGKYQSLTIPQRRWLKRRQAVEPAIGHLKSDHRMDRCWLQGKLGDALHAVLCAAGYNLRWLMRAVLRLGLKGILLPFALLQLINRFRAKQPYIGEAFLYTKPPPQSCEFCRADYLIKGIKWACCNLS
ncbi:transposase, partial [uncultured Nitrosomonas sp.]|uniref:transposase n=1 Tax=uncultured Nitrosomonas sp. TaxID=156424 RepID=UPI00345AB40C